MTHRGGGWQPVVEAPAPDAAVSLVLLGDAGAPGRVAADVAAQLDATLAAERASGRTPVLLWLGNVLLDRRGRPDCPAASAPWTREGVSELARVARHHVDQGGASYAIPGEAAYRCGARAQMTQIGDGPHPWQMPAAHYVVDVHADGKTDIVATCRDGSCKAGDSNSDPVVQLVFADITPWIAGERPADQDVDLRGLRSLLDLLRSTEGPPRVLVTHYPLEAAGFHGQGGADPDSTLHTMPPPLTTAVRDGVFVGNVAAHDRSTYAAADISDAAMRSDRVFLAHPMFEVVSGAASTPDARVRSGFRRLRYNTASSYAPSTYTPRAGFAVLHLGATGGAARLFARSGRRWKSADVPITLAPRPHPVLVRTPSMTPCLRCPRTPVNERN